jgi:hypothetical protein
MRAFEAAYIGRHEFPKNLSEFELRQWFTFDERDRRWHSQGIFRSRQGDSWRTTSRVLPCARLCLTEYLRTRA